MLKYPEDIVSALPEVVVVSFAGVGNPFPLGRLLSGATVLEYAKAQALHGKTRRG